MIAATAAVTTSYVGYKAWKHASRDLVTGSVCMQNNPDISKHESWNAVVDNYVYIHNAFRNDLQAIKEKAEKGEDFKAHFDMWVEILDVHSRFEDEVMIPSLTARVKRSSEKDQAKKELEKVLKDTSKDHEEVHKLIDAVKKDGSVAAIDALQNAMEEHLKAEESAIPKLLLEHFTQRELWALDSFIINPKLGYCSAEMLKTITFWWFGNITFSEGWPLLKNFIKAGNQPKMADEKWLELQADIPALKDYALVDLVS